MVFAIGTSFTIIGSILQTRMIDTRFQTASLNIEVPRARAQVRRKRRSRPAPERFHGKFT